MSDQKESAGDGRKMESAMRAIQIIKLHKNMTKTT
jgi:hypothetical protein